MRCPTCENLYDDDKIRILRCTFAPNVGHERHFHPPHFVYVLSGGQSRATNPVGTGGYEVSSGYYWAGNAIEWHDVVNTGDTTQCYLLVEKRY